MLKDIWRVLTGRLSWKLQTYWYHTALDWQVEAVQAAQLKRDLSLANAAIAKLKSQLPANYEAQRKAESDALGDRVIADMKQNPEKYLP